MGKEEKQGIVPMSKYLSEEQTKKYLQSILGNRTEQFITTLSSLVGSDKNLNECSRNSIMGCALKATSMGLPIDSNLGQAYIIPYDSKYGKQAQFQIGYKGFIQLALRSSQIIQINATDVREGEIANRDILGEPTINWLTEEARKDKKIVGYMAGFRLVNGFVKMIYWTIQDIEKHRDKYSQAYRYALKIGQKDAVWIEKFDEMAKKTVLKALLSKYAPLSTIMQEAIKADQAVITIDETTGEEQVFYVDNEENKVVEIELISKEQIEELAELIGDNMLKFKVINDYGYKVINDIETKDFDEIRSKIKKIKSKEE